MTVKFKTTEGRTDFTIDEETSGFVKQFDLPTGVSFRGEVEISGEGCLLIQSATKYNQKDLEEDKSFTLKYRAGSAQYCVKRSKSAGKTGMAIIEVQHATGYVLDEAKLDEDRAKDKKLSFIKRYA